MKKNVVIGVLVITVLVLVIAAEIFYLARVRPRVTFDLEGLSGEEEELVEIEKNNTELDIDETLFTEIDDVFSDVFEIIDPDRAINETDIASEAALADLSTDLAAEILDEQSSQEIDQTLNELSY